MFDWYNVLDDALQKVEARISAADDDWDRAAALALPEAPEGLSFDAAFRVYLLCLGAFSVAADHDLEEQMDALSPRLAVLYRWAFLLFDHPDPTYDQKDKRDAFHALIDEASKGAQL